MFDVSNKRMNEIYFSINATIVYDWMHYHRR